MLINWNILKRQYYFKVSFNGHARKEIVELWAIAYLFIYMRRGTGNFLIVKINVACCAIDQRGYELESC